MKYCKYIGLKADKSTPLQRKIYTPATNKEVAVRFLDYLKEMDQQQRGRSDTIENKNSLMVGQASIVISIISLFVPLLIDKFSQLHICLIISLLIIFLVVLWHYLWSIIHSIRTLLIDKYPYVTRSITTVTRENRANDELGFINEEISDLVSALDQNSEMNNRKGGNLIFAARCFKIGNVFFAILTILVIGSSFLLPRKQISQEIRISNFNDLQFLKSDTLNDTLIYNIDWDTLQIIFNENGLGSIYRVKQ